MSTYTVTRLARLAGVSVRTLHHYDEIGLLKPAFVGANGYRYYGREQLLRLQDILFHRELGVALADIGPLLAAGEADRLARLRQHREHLADRVSRSRELLRTIDRTIAALEGKTDMDDTHLYTGFSREQQAGYEDWLADRLGEEIREHIATSRETLTALGKQGFDTLMAEGDAISDKVAELFASGTAQDDLRVSALLELHRDWLGRTWGRECPPMAYGSMADIYLGHPDFAVYFEKRGQGFTTWFAEAIRLHAASIAPED